MALRDVIGQDRAVNILFRTLDRGRLPSAYLFAGESGIGKKFTAVNLAKAVNCLNPAARDTGKMDACDACSSCRKIGAETHPDFMIITPEKGEIRVNEIRAVEQALSYRPFEGRRKVVIVDDADAMNQSAANAFLKTLEEPPDESLLVLVAAHPDRLPETIRSRCSRINFAPLSPVLCEKVIQSAHSEKEDQDTAAGIPVLVRLCMGRPGLAFSSDRMKERERYIALLRGMLAGDGETWTDREEMEQWLDMLLVIVRDIAVLKIAEEASPKRATSKVSIGERPILLNEDIGDFIAGMARTARLENIMNAYRKMVFLKQRLDFNLNKGITWNYTASVLKDTIGSAS